MAGDEGRGAGNRDMDWNDPEQVREYQRDIQRRYRERRAQGVPLRSRRRVDNEGRECSSCGEYKPWDDFGSGGGPHGKERRCKACMSAKSVAYAKRQPDPLKQKRNARQKAYQRTEVGKDSRRRARLKHRYGITEEQYDWLYAQQEGLCYVCALEETVPHYATGEPKRLGVEHDHGCDQGHDPAKACPSCIRGLACYNCNIYMARVEKSDRLRPRFADYLARRPLLASGAPA